VGGGNPCARGGGDTLDGELSLLVAHSYFLGAVEIERLVVALTGDRFSALTCINYCAGISNLRKIVVNSRRGCPDVGGVALRH